MRYPSLKALVFVGLVLAGYHETIAQGIFTPERWRREHANLATCEDIRLASSNNEKILEFQLAWISSLEEDLAEEWKGELSNCETKLKGYQLEAKQAAAIAPYRLAAAILLAEENKFSSWYTIKPDTRASFSSFARNLRNYNAEPVTRASQYWRLLGGQEETVVGYVELAILYTEMEPDLRTEWREKEFVLNNARFLFHLDKTSCDIATADKTIEHYSQYGEFNLEILKNLCGGMTVSEAYDLPAPFF